jgi:hypothetical protein
VVVDRKRVKTSERGPPNTCIIVLRRSPPPSFLSPSGIKRSREVESIVNKYSSATKKPRTAAAVGIADDRVDADSCASPSNKLGRRVGAPPDSESSRAWAESLGPPGSEPFSPGVFK